MTMLKKLSKAKNGKIVKKSTIKDPDNNTIKTKINTRTGATKTVVKYDDSQASGAKREVTKTPGLTRMQRKANEMYAKNPQAAEEDSFKPFTPGMKKGGVKMKTGGMVNSNSKVTALKIAGSKGVKSGVNTKISASNVAKGSTGGTSSAPKTATPKAKMGGMMRMKKK